MFRKVWNNTSSTQKAAVTAICILMLGICIVAGTKAAFAANLKAVSIIQNDNIKLGDLFDGVKRNADYVIGKAPAPGEEVTLNARTLYRIAVSMNIDWRPLSSSDQITIRREAAVVSYHEIEKMLRNALENKGLNGNYAIVLNTGKPTITLPVDAPEQVELSAIDFDVQKDFFHATLVAPSVKNPIEKLQVSGMVKRIVSVPVLRSNLQNGDVIGANDIEMIDVEQGKLQPNIILDTQDMIGLTPRRIAYAGKFVPVGALDRPQLITRGDNVTITFIEGSLNLSAKGKALQSGAKGDLVRVTNITSSRTVDAIVSGENQVTVQ